jgi:ribonuclease HI
MKKKFYVVWQGRQPGIYENWSDCKDQIHGYQGAKYKSFKTLVEAQAAFQLMPTQEFSFSKNTTPKIELTHLPNPPIANSICVDGAHSQKTQLSEYQGILLETGERLFYQGPFYGGTNNLMEFLAIVHALALCNQKGWNLPIYSDSQTAISWVKQKHVNTTMKKNEQNQKIFLLVEKALNWLHKHTYENLILKWDTENWGENPADFGRK